MDTRSKIVPFAEAIEHCRGNHCQLVLGYFDPVYAPHAQRLEEIAAEGKPLVVLVAEPESPLLSADARAQMVASLFSVAHVAVAGGFSSSLPLIDERNADLARRDALLAHIRRRHEV